MRDLAQAVRTASAAAVGNSTSGLSAFKGFCMLGILHGPRALTEIRPIFYYGHRDGHLRG